jgi:chromosome segregation ATPase
MLTIDTSLLIYALGGVLGGVVLARIGAALTRRKVDTHREDTDHRIRALDAEMRILQKKAQEAELALERHREESDGLRKAVHTSTATLAERDSELKRLRHSLTEECGKTATLRHELSARVEETVRARARIKDAETELSVARAGSDQVLEQVQRLAAEREELTGRLRVLQAEASGRGAIPTSANVSRIRETKDR